MNYERTSTEDSLRIVCKSVFYTDTFLCDLQQKQLQFHLITPPQIGNGDLFLFGL